MLELSEIFKRMSIGTMYPRKLIKILNGLDDIYVKTNVGGHVLLSNGAVLECVSRYYELPKNIKKIKNVDLATSCYRVRQALDIFEEIPPLCCQRCHCFCANLELEGKVTRKGKGVNLS